MDAFRHYLYITGAIAIVVMMHFSSELKNDFSLDDYLYVDQVKNILSWSELHLATEYPFSISDFRPVTSVTFAIENILFKGEINPHVSHGINLFIYFLCCVFLYYFLQKIIPDERKKVIALIATLLFIALPLHNSMVSNIKSRDGLLSFMFGMLYLNTLIRIAFTKLPALKIFYLVISFVFLALGIFSKLDAFNFLAISPLLYFIFSKRWNYRFLLRVLFALTLTFSAAHQFFNYWGVKKNVALKTYSKELQSDPILFSENPIIAYPEISYKIAYTIQTVYEYGIMVFAPGGHYYYYGYDMLPVLPLTDSSVIFKAFVIFALILSALIFYKKNILYSFGIAFYFISLIYCANFLTPVSGIIADRYIFIASAGACLALASILFSLMELTLPYFSLNNASLIYINSSKSRSISISSMLVLIVFFISTIFYLPKNINRCNDWKSLTSIFEADLPEISKYSYDANLMAMKNYMSYAKISQQPQKDIYCKKVIGYGQNARKIYPEGQYAQDLMISAYYEMGSLYDALDLSREVIARFDTTEMGWRILNEYYYYKSDFDSLLLSSSKVLKLSPLDPFINMMYVDALNETNNESEAIKHIEYLKTQYPDSKLPEQIIELRNER